MSTKETQLLCTLLPTLPDFLLIEQAIREKYNLPVISPDDDPISEIYLDYEIKTLEEFCQAIENLIRENLKFLSPETDKLYRSIKGISQTNHFRTLNYRPTIFSATISTMDSMRQIPYLIDILMGSDS